MKRRLISLEKLSSALKPLLPRYLEDHGIDISKNFSCINPKHEDTNPSMTCRKHPEAAYCFSCGTVADIFQAASFLEGKPTKGKEFLEENALYLAKKYNVEIPLEELTREEIYEYKTYQAYQLAHEIISDRDFGNYELADKEIERRNWDKEKIANWGIGTISFEELKKHLKASGYEVNFLDSIDLNNPKLFNEENLIFTVFDEEGRPVGFSAKRLVRDEKTSRYINTRENNLKCAIFKKSYRLYNFDIAAHTPGSLYIFEGQADVVTAKHYGVMNCCSTLGTSLTDHHLVLLQKHGKFNIVLVYDSDPAGKKATEKHVTKLSKAGFKIQLCQLPEGKDPDELIREEGFGAFQKLKHWEAFEWQLTQHIQELDEEIDEEKRQEIAEQMIPIILSEENYLHQYNMTRELSEKIGLDFEVLQSEIKRRRDVVHNEVVQKKMGLVDAFVYNAKKYPEELDLKVLELRDSLLEVDKSLSVKDETDLILSDIMSIKEVDDKKTGEFEGFHMQNLGHLANRLNGDWRKNMLFFIGGSEQSAKTTLASQMAYEIANDPRNDAVCIYFTIDDATKPILYKWVCNAANNLSLNLQQVQNPNFFKDDPRVLRTREKAYNKIFSMVKDQRLLVRDSGSGTSLGYIFNVVKSIREKFPKKNIVLFIDNFYNLTDYSEIQGQERTKRISKLLKKLTTDHKVTTVATVEYRKLQMGEKPSNLAIAESRALAYDSNIILHLYNEMHYRESPDQTMLVHEHDNAIFPRIWAKFGKNKVSGFETLEFLNLYPFWAHLRSVEPQVALTEAAARKEENNIKKLG